MNDIPERISLTLAHQRDMTDALRYENYQILSLVQALWGAVSTNMVLVSLKVTGDEVHVFFYLEGESETDRALVEEVVDDLGTLQFTDVPIEAHVKVVGANVANDQIEGRWVFRRHNGDAA